MFEGFGDEPESVETLHSSEGHSGSGKVGSWKRCGGYVYLDIYIYIVEAFRLW